jgi:hypothetical protein
VFCCWRPPTHYAQSSTICCYAAQGCLHVCNVRMCTTACVDCCRVVCMSCGANTCRHSFQEALVGLNPAAAEQLGAARGISSQAAWQRALAAGTAADARKVAAGQQAEQVGVGGSCRLCSGGNCWQLACMSAVAAAVLITSLPLLPACHMHACSKCPMQGWGCCCRLQIPVRRPDGDVEVADAGHAFVVPPCSSCGGVLKPDVVFFGDAVPRERADR